MRAAFRFPCAVPALPIQSARPRLPAGTGGSDVQVGIFYMPTAYTADVVTLARRVEELGFESLWVPDHPIMPVERTSPFPGGGEMPDTYAHLMALAAAAGATEHIRLGTGIVLAAEREPLVLAKEVATLDLVSNGRFEFGVGAGWQREEAEILGVHWRRRWAHVREHVLAMKACWRDGLAEFHGEYVDFPPVWSDPKPVQRPVHVGPQGGVGLHRTLLVRLGHFRLAPADPAVVIPIEIRRHAEQVGTERRRFRRWRCAPEEPQIRFVREVIGQARTAGQSMKIRPERALGAVVEHLERRPVEGEAVIRAVRAADVLRQGGVSVQRRIPHRRVAHRFTLWDVTGVRHRTERRGPACARRTTRDPQRRAGRGRWPAGACPASSCNPLLLLRTAPGSRWRER